MTAASLLTSMAYPRGHSAVVFVMKGVVGAHVGIDYSDAEGARRHIHLAGHHRLTDEPMHMDGRAWVETQIDELMLQDVATVARQIARKHAEHRIPYGFDLKGPDFDAQGRLDLKGGLGLTCATFVLKVFARGRVELLSLASWNSDRSDARIQEDNDAQHELIKTFRHRDEAHFARVEAQVGSTRVRAEEVAAASTLANLPAPYAEVEPLGRALLDAVQAALS